MRSRFASRLSLPPALAEPLLVYGSAAICTAAGAAYFLLRGPLPVMRGTSELPLVTPLRYLIPVFVPFGILMGEGVWAWLARSDAAFLRALPWQLAALCITAAARIKTAYPPVSGHTLLLAYFLLHEGITQRGRHPVRIAIGLAVLVEVGYYKLWVWDDLETFTWGLTVGAAIWAAGLLTRIRLR